MSGASLLHALYRNDVDGRPSYAATHLHHDGELPTRGIQRTGPRQRDYEGVGVILHVLRQRIRELSLSMRLEELLTRDFMTPG